MIRKSAVFLGVVLVLSTSVWAQQRMHGARILHEYFSGQVPSDGHGGGTSASPRPELPVVQESTEPTDPPALSGEVGSNELVWGADGPAADTRLSAPNGPLNPFGSSHSLDTRTDRVDSLNYFENFDPSIIPFKRVVSLNTFIRSAGGQYSVELASGTYRKVSITPVLGERDEVFWGTFAIDAERGRWLPLASVAPDQRILQVTTEPQVVVEVHADAAGNHYLRTNHQGLLRVNMQVAVSKDYFSGVFGDVGWDAFDGMLAPVDPATQAAAEQVFKQIGVSRQQRPAEVLRKLVEYYRDFEGKPFPGSAQGRDMLVAIVEEQAGVCRHRSLAFLVTMHALGIPTHYVYNEAHAFAEVYWPGLGWRRVDLGGAADELNSASDNQTSIHAPADNLPQPPRFLEEQERMAMNSPGASAGAAQNAADAAGEEGVQGEDGATSVEGAPSPNPLAETEESAGEATPRVATRLTLQAENSVVQRGKPLLVFGQLVSANGVGIEGREVEVHIAPLGVNRPSANSRVARINTSMQGRYSKRIMLPEDFAVGRWSLFVSFPGDEEYKPSIGE